MAAHKGFDAPRECGTIAGNIPDDIDFVIRYLSHNPAKNLTMREAVALNAVDCQLVTVWESAGTNAAFFSARQGMADAAAALAEAQAIGQPKTSPIYFAVDFDASPADPDDINTRILPYFQSVAAKLAGQYEVGVYGSGLVCARLRLAHVVSYLWLAGAMSWRGSHGFADWHLRQSIVTGDPLGLGFSVDLDESRDDDYGGWTI